MEQLPQQPVETKVKFGFSQLFKPTPELAKLTFRVVLYAAVILLYIVNNITEIPEPVKIGISKYSLFAVGFVHFISKLFGLEIKDVN